MNRQPAAVQTRDGVYVPRKVTAWGCTDQPGLPRLGGCRRGRCRTFDNALDSQVGAEQRLVDGKLLLRLAGERGSIAGRAAIRARPPSRASPVRRIPRSAYASTARTADACPAA